MTKRNQGMTKRNLFAEITEGFEALTKERAGRKTLRLDADSAKKECRYSHRRGHCRTDQSVPK